jgi:flagellar motor switch/type III secretory pathway protein FliN
MRKIDAKSLMDLKVRVDFELGCTVKELSEVLQFKKGTLIKLDNSEKNVIQVYINGKIHAYGKALREEGEMYIKITKMYSKEEGS